MRFLADENFPGDAVRDLRAAGHDVVWVRTDAPSMKDGDILTWAMRDHRILLTFDKDFGELAYRARLPAECGIVLVRTPMPSPTAVSVAIAHRGDWAGHFSVIEPGRVRMRSLVGSS